MSFFHHYLHSIFKILFTLTFHDLRFGSKKEEVRDLFNKKRLKKSPML